jgi:CBS domain-containing protein
MIRHEGLNEMAQRGIEELRTIRDEIRLDLHLASMDLRDEWRLLDGRLSDLDAVNRLRDLTKDAVDGLTEELRRFRSRLRARRETGDAARLMTGNPVTCGPHETLAQAVVRMWDLDIGWLPVVDENRLTGVLTDRDACIAACTRGKRMDELTVASVMSQKVWSCAPQDSIQELLALMRVHQFRRLPVLDGMGHLLGVITLGDIARAPESQGEQAGRHAADVGATLAEISAPRKPRMPLH